MSGLLLGAWLVLPVASWAEGADALLQLRTSALGLSPDPALMAPGLDFEAVRFHLDGVTPTPSLGKPGFGETYLTVTVCGPDGVSRTYTYALGEEGKVVERIYGDFSGPSQLDRQRLGLPPLPGRRR